jgi:Flp pilus assembly protein TadD
VQILTAALLACATLVAFSGVLRHGWFLLDDPDYVYKNPHVTMGWSRAGLLWFLHEPHGGNWHPLTSYSHMLDAQWFGPGPTGPHAVSLALHVLNALLLLFVLHGMTGAWWRSLFAAGLFALHPLRVESVAWIAERKDVLSTFFFLLTLLAYRRWAARPSPRRWSLVVGGFVLGLLSKPMVVTLPFVLVLLDVWPLGRLRAAGASAPAPAPEPRESQSAAAPRPGARRAAAPRPLAFLLLEKWPLFALAAASAVVTIIVQRQTGSVLGVGFLPPAQRLMNALLSYWRYVGMMIWPVRLAPYYPLDRSLHAATALAAACGLAAVTFWVIRQARVRPYLLVGWWWYIGTLVPVIGLLQVGRQAYADRYTYIPCIGLLVALVWGVEELVRRSRAAQVVAVALGLAALAALSLGTQRQVALWQDSRTLFAHTIAVTHPDAFSHRCLGVALSEAKRSDEAIVEFQRSLALDPSRADVRFDLGLALAQSGRLAEAEQEFGRAARLAPNDPGLALREGEAALLMGKPREAEADFRRALALRSGSAETLDRLGVVLAMEGRPDEAIAFLRRSTSLMPSDPQTRFHLATALIQLGGHDAEAAAQLEQAIRLAPGWADPCNQLAWLLATSPDSSVRNGGEALRLSARAVELSGGRDANALDTQAAAQAAAGRFDEAAATARAAGELARRAGADSLALAIEARRASFLRHVAFVDSMRGSGTPGPQRDVAGSP